MNHFKENRNLFVIALIAVVNALGYGIIFPLIYSYSKHYGLTDFENGLLFALFSICQFISTPFIGRLSDKYGRKPLLIASISGTALSFFLMAFAPTAIFLYIARALDGITAGNIPVATAVISDTTEQKDRARGFGIIGASFGFGMIFGPAISAFTLGFGANVPLIIAGIISIVAVVLTAILLPETNKHMGEIRAGRLFDFGKMFKALFDENVGTTLLITLVYYFAFSLWIYAFQPYALEVLHMTAAQVPFIFVMYGIIGLLMQVFFIQKVINKFGLKKTYTTSFLLIGLSFLLMFLFESVPLYILSSLLLGISSSFVMPLTQTILSKETDEKSQGTIFGLNSSYMSLGQIFGPIVGGIIATYFIPLPFLLGAAVMMVCFYLSFKVLRPNIKKEAAF